MKKLRVLLVDDEIMIREGFKRLFDWAAHDCEVVGEAADGMEALSRIDALCPDIVIMDINMPVMNGYEAATLIKKKSPATPILALTAYATSADEEKILASGMDAYMSKPVCMPQLRMRLKDLLNK